MSALMAPVPPMRRRGDPPGRAARVPSADDATLVAGLVARDPAAAMAAWDRFGPVVRGLLARHVGGTCDRDDLVQEVFLHFFRKVVDLREPAAVGSYIVGITIRVARGELRRRRLRRWLRLTPDGDVQDIPAPCADHEAREALARVERMLGELDSEVRMAFVLRHVHGMELQEVARALGCSLATTKRRILKANQVLAARVRGDRRIADALARYGVSP